MSSGRYSPARHLRTFLYGAADSLKTVTSLHLTTHGYNNKYGYIYLEPEQDCRRKTEEGDGAAGKLLPRPEVSACLWTPAPLFLGDPRQAVPSPLSLTLVEATATEDLPSAQSMLQLLPSLLPGINSLELALINPSSTSLPDMSRNRSILTLNIELFLHPQRRTLAQPDSRPAAPQTLHLQLSSTGHS